VISEALLKILACPLSKAPLILEGDRLISRDPETRRVYPIREGIPIMLIQESSILEEEEWKAILKKHPLPEIKEEEQARE
jgi:uncharacterized protein YbaR (Trm112 family)